jgi:4a-hydroxytetrahydrobiopterin dehydratase
MISALTEDQRSDALAALPKWTYDAARKALYRHLLCGDFLEAIEIMTQVAFEADRADHHPEWSNVYNRIDIWLTTHDAGGVSERDLQLAQRIDSIVGG